jgi:hypothetical protein
VSGKVLNLFGEHGADSKDAAHAERLTKIR